MAYTTTTSGKNTTAVGTSGSDTLGESTKPVGDAGTLQVNSFEGDDTAYITAATSGNVGMGGGSDIVDVSDALITSVSITLGDSKDTFVSDQADSKITVGGQGGADTFVIKGASEKSRYAGGQGKDTFSLTVAAKEASLIGGSEDDTFSVTEAATKLFVNGQVGEDTITVADKAATGTIRGGSEDDTISVGNGVTGSSLYGDKGADKITDGTGANKLYGGGGKDTLIAGGGYDTISGGDGVDRFEFTEGESGKIKADVAFDTFGDDAAKSTFTFDKIAETEYVTDFVSGTDTVRIAAAGGVAVNAYKLAKEGVAAGTAKNIYFAYGTYNAALGTFVAAATGSDTIVSTNDNVTDKFLAAADDYIVFKDTNLATTDFSLG